MTDPLERDLLTLRPRAPAPRVAVAIGRRLAARPRRPYAALAGLLAAAALLLAVGLRRPAAPPPPPPAAARADAPTLLAYRRALAESPDRLDDLLQRHAAGPAAAAADSWHPIAYASLDSLK